MTDCKVYKDQIGFLIDVMNRLRLAITLLLTLTLPLSGQSSGKLSNLSELNQRFVSITQKTLDVVVNITVWKNRGAGKRPYQKISEGSGVVVSKHGFVVTNNHVLDGGDQFRVTFHDGTELESIPIGPNGQAYLSDKKTDIAMIKIPLKRINYQVNILPIGDSDQLQVGEWVIAVGNPFGLHHTVTTGIVSAKSRVNVGFADYEDFIQTDAAINPGNSGGALVNLEGQLIGINTAIKTNNGGYQGISFAIPINMVMHISKMLLRYGQVIRGWMGFIIKNRPLTNNPNRDRAEVYSVLPYSPAARSGLQPGDVIVGYQDKKVQSYIQLRNWIARAQVGETVQLDVLRQNRVVKLHVQVGKRPVTEVGRRIRTKSIALTGMEVQDLPGKRGVEVIYVQANSPAQQANVTLADQIREINGRRVYDMASYNAIINLLQDGQKIEMMVDRKGNIHILALMATLSRR